MEIDDYTSIATRSFAEALSIIENSSDSYLLFTDNLQVNPEVRNALASLRDRPELRQRVWIVGLAVFNNTAWITDGLIDEYLPMPFTVDQLFDIVEAHASDPPC